MSPSAEDEDLGAAEKTKEEDEAEEKKETMYKVIDKADKEAQFYPRYGKSRL